MQIKYEPMPPAYSQVDLAEALRYIQDDLRGTSLALNLMDRTADGLSLLVSQMVQAAANVLPGATTASYRLAAASTALSRTSCMRPQASLIIEH